MELQVAQPLNQWLPHARVIYATKKITYPRRKCLITKYQPEKNDQNPNSQSNQITDTREN